MPLRLRLAGLKGDWSGHSVQISKSTASYKDKVQEGKRGPESSKELQPKRAKFGKTLGRFKPKPREGDAKLKSQDWKNRACFVYHQPGQQAKS